VDNYSVIRKTGWFGLAGFVVLLLELVLRTSTGAQPLITDVAGRMQYFTMNRNLALSWILLDMIMYMCNLVFFAGFRKLIIMKHPDFEWAATLALVAGAVWWAVSLVADGLEGGAILNARGTVEPAVFSALEEGTILIWNGAIAFAVTGFFLAVAGYSILGTNALPKWVGNFAWVSAILCALCVPAIFVNSMDHTEFYNPAGWGPMIVANILPLFWFLFTSIFMIRKR
jgi:branched-subunit amino acid transport protein